VIKTIIAILVRAHAERRIDKKYTSRRDLQQTAAGSS
jgi:hypothetical protein